MNLYSIYNLEVELVELVLWLALGLGYVKLHH